MKIKKYFSIPHLISWVILMVSVLTMLLVSGCGGGGGG